MGRKVRDVSGVVSLCAVVAICYINVSKLQLRGMGYKKKCSMLQIKVCSFVSPCCYSGGHMYF